MVGIVIVSHSKKLAEGIKELALQMGQAQVKIAVAGGLEETSGNFLIGTDPLRIEAAIRKVFSNSGVVVMVDIGSAIMSTEIALENFSEQERTFVLLCEAPLVEGTIAATVQAAAGSSLAKVATEARAALLSKIQHINPSISDTIQVNKPVIGLSNYQFQLAVPNRLGLHARPAARLVNIINQFDVEVEIHVAHQRIVSAHSISQVATLGARHGDILTFYMKGKDIDRLEQELLNFAKANFGDVALNEAIKPAFTSENTNATKPQTAGHVIGEPAAPGMAIATIIRLEDVYYHISKTSISDTKAEVRKLFEALQKANNSFRLASEGLPITQRDLFDFHLLILGDRELIQKAAHIISHEQTNASYAWSKVMDNLMEQYSQMPDRYQREKTLDIQEIRQKVISALSGQLATRAFSEVNGILVVDELGPADTAELDPNHIKGIITRKGGTTSHTAIIARALGIPAIVGIGDAIENFISGDIIAIDGATGDIWRENLHAEKVAKIQRKQQLVEQERQQLVSQAQAVAITKDGRKIQVMANVSGPKQAKLAAEVGADGIGLYRTEFLFMNRTAPPSEEEQYQTYQAVANYFNGKPVTIRTLDVGGDKPISYLKIGQEKNPFLGLRGIRYCLQNTLLFKTQLRAICRASASAPILMMYPMVGVVEEIIEANKLLRTVQQELQQEGIPYDEKMKVGIMVEVPSVIFTLPTLANHVDFMSIGTNDLTQYLLALDRENKTVARFHQATHPSVLLAVHEIIKKAKAAHVEISMCGELAGNVQVIQLLTEMGLDKLSMSSAMIPQVKLVVRSISKDAAYVESFFDKAFTLQESSQLLDNH